MRPAPRDNGDLSSQPEIVYYKRSRFSTKLYRDRRYTASHYWIARESDGVLRIGFTKFATRMLGDLVEIDLTVKPCATVSVGQVIGNVEGFKAVTAVYCVATGEFLGTNPTLDTDITRADVDPYLTGWLYKVRGEPESETLDLEGYTAVLDATIDKMLASRHDAGKD